MPRRPGGQMESREGKVGAAGWPPTAPVPRPTPQTPAMRPSQPCWTGSPTPSPNHRASETFLPRSPRDSYSESDNIRSACWPPM